MRIGICFINGFKLYILFCFIFSIISHDFTNIEKYQFTSVAQSCPTLCDPMDCSITHFPVHHQHPELAQTHVHRVGDAIQQSYPLSSPSPPAFYLSQHQGFFPDENESALRIRWPKLMLRGTSYSQGLWGWK